MSKGQKNSLNGEGTLLKLQFCTSASRWGSHKVFPGGGSNINFVMGRRGKKSACDRAGGNHQKKAQSAVKEFRKYT